MSRALAALAILFLPASAAADDTRIRWLDNDFYKVSADVRARVELADFDGFERSEAYTIRARLGLGTRPVHGFSAFAEGEGTLAFAETHYFDGASSNRSGQSVIADPENVELNRAWVQFERQEWLGLKAKGGRQRIILDDARFVGNVGWRQNEQTYDAALGETSLGVEGLSLQYAYVWDVRRIFGDQGPTAATRDFDSDSHLLRVHYRGSDSLQVTAFAYLLDFRNDAAARSSNSYGLRLTGHLDLWADLRLEYAGSYAYQTDAARNPTHYHADYGAAEGRLAWKRLGTLGVGYEFLGSGSGGGVFATPLATGHKFNGYADAFLGNGGLAGLQDFYLKFAPKLPWQVAGEVIYHEFWSDRGGDHLGREVDAVAKRPLTSRVTALTKFAWFDGRSRGPAGRWRFWFQLHFGY